MSNCGNAPRPRPLLFANSFRSLPNRVPPGPPARTLLSCTSWFRLQGSGAERYVLDIRNNGGGLFPAGVEVAKMLINTGDIVLIADSDGIRDVYSADFTAIEDKKPLSVRFAHVPLSPSPSPSTAFNHGRTRWLSALLKAPVAISFQSRMVVVLLVLVLHVTEKAFPPASNSFSVV